MLCIIILCNNIYLIDDAGLLLIYYIAFLKSEIGKWVKEDEQHNVVFNEDLLELENLGTWLSVRARNFVQTRQKDLASFMGVPKDWLEWFNRKEQKSMKCEVHAKFRGMIWTDERQTTSADSVSIHMNLFIIFHINNFVHPVFIISHSGDDIVIYF